MQRDHWYTSDLAFDALDSAVSVGREAARRAVARLDPRPITTGDYPVLFVPEMARQRLGPMARRKAADQPLIDQHRRQPADRHGQGVAMQYGDTQKGQAEQVEFQGRAEQGHVHS